MNQTYTFNGHCPEQSKDYSVTVTYLDASTLNEKKFIRGLAKCEYASFHGCKHIDDCPILNAVPDEL